METFKTQGKRTSFVRARYSSIIAHGSPYIANNSELGIHISNLESSNDNEKNSRENQEDKLRLHVYLRMKKVSNWDHYNLLDDKTLICKVPNSTKLRQGLSYKKMYTFSKIFGPDAVQSDLFEYVKLKVAHFINGYNCSLLTYGASGSGKTYTIVGTASEPGIIPRALEHIFRSLPLLPKEPHIKPLVAGGITELNDLNKKMERLATQSLLDKFNTVDQYQHSRTYKAMQQHLVQDVIPDITYTATDVTFAVWVSFAEIYNEYIYDLLKTDLVRGQERKKLRLGHSNGNTYIKDLSFVSVSSGLEAYQILQYGLQNLKYAATSVNAHSSRSHAIFTIKLAQTSDVDKGVYVSSFNFCDLAGSERAKKTNNIGDRLKESNNINTSLLVLGRCIQLIRESQKYKDARLIPFRESKLTQLFQKALSGQEAISMIVNVNPVLEMYSETQQALNFSAIVKDVVLEEQELIIHELQNKFVQYLNNSNANLMDIVEEDDNYELEELQNEAMELYEYYTQIQSEATVYQTELKNRYKKLVQDTENYWEKRYRDLKEKIEAERVKKRNTSIIVLDSSSDEEEDNEDESNKLIKQNEENTQKIIKIKDELKVLQERNKELKESLKDAQYSYLQLNSQYCSETSSLSKEISLECDKGKEAQMIYEDLLRQLNEKLENQEESKTSTEESKKFTEESENFIEEDVNIPEKEPCTEV